MMTVHIAKTYEQYRQARGHCYDCTPAQCARYSVRRTFSANSRFAFSSRSTLNFAGSWNITLEDHTD